MAGRVWAAGTAHKHGYGGPGAADNRRKPTIGSMRTRFEEEPEPIEVPDDPDEPEVEPEPVATGGPALVPSVAGPVEREDEYKVGVITLEEGVDGKTLPGRLSRSS